MKLRHLENRRGHQSRVERESTQGGGNFIENRAVTLTMCRPHPKTRRSGLFTLLPNWEVTWWGRVAGAVAPHLLCLCA